MRRWWLIAPLAAAACSGRVGDPGFEATGPSSTSGPSGPTGSTGPTGPTGANCDPVAVPVTPRLRRLTFAQYDRTVSELMGLEVRPSAELGPEVDGITPTLWSGVESAAASVAAQVAANPTAYARLVPCTPSGDGAACAGQVIDRLGRLAYRRTLSTAERDAYLATYTDRAQLTANGTFEEWVEIFVEMVLQAPNFLLRVERSQAEAGGRVALSGEEVATRMSYALWNGPPDEALLDAAAAGNLATPEGRRAQAERMLEDAAGLARARSLLRAASSDYLGMVGAYAAFWSNTQRDPSLFPEFYAGIDVDFREEVLRYVDHVAFDQSGGFKDLLTSPQAVVSGRLAPIYGLPAGNANTWTPVTLDPEERPGLLTRVGFLGTHGRFTRGSLIFRGSFVLHRILCETTGAPPAGAESTPLPMNQAELVTTRQRIDAMTAGAPCNACHTSRINPMGYAYEAFDAIGRHRTTDNGASVDTTGTLRLDGAERSFSNAKEYAELLAASPQAQRCFVHRFGEFTFSDSGVDLGCTEKTLAEHLALPNATIKSFLVELVASDAFAYRSPTEAP